MTALLGIHLTVLAGTKVPAPLPADFIEALECLEVAEGTEGRSAFQIVFALGRGNPPMRGDYPLLASGRLEPFNRVVVVVTVGTVAQVLMDGFVTHQELAPGDGKEARLLVTGEDVSLMMDLKEQIKEHPGQSEAVIAAKIILAYAQYGLVPKVIPPPAPDVPLPIERTPVQRATDLRYLQIMAARFGYVFYLSPGPAPMMNVAYWGPPPLVGLPQPALSVAMNSVTNVESLRFQYDGLAAATQWGRVQDRRTNKVGNVNPTRSTLPALSRRPALTSNRPNVPQRLFDGEALTLTQARAYAQGRVNDSTQRVVTACGELNALAYGGVLRARSLVGVRGAGEQFDGSYYVKEVRHVLKPGEYKQRFTLTREGLGAQLPLVRP